VRILGENGRENGTLPEVRRVETEGGETEGVRLRRGENSACIAGLQKEINI